jgi:hypothetical protein
MSVWKRDIAMTVPSRDDAPLAGCAVRIIASDTIISIRPRARQRYAVFSFADCHERRDRFDRCVVKQPWRLFGESGNFYLDNRMIVMRDERASNCTNLHKLENANGALGVAADKELRREVLLEYG